MSRPALAWGSDLAALAAALLGAGSSTLWARLYFQINSPGFLLALLLLLLALLLLPVVLAGALRGAAAARRLLRGEVLASAALWLGVLASGGNLNRSPLPGLLGVALCVGSLGAWALGRSAAPWWPRARGALLVAASSYCLSAPLLGTWFAHDMSLFPADGAARRTPTVWLLLDETSYGAAPKLVAPLRELGLHVQWHPLQPAGQNTLDVVPSFVGRRVMGPSTAPCGPAVVCAENASLAWSRVSAGRSGVDLVGFYHPYCAMRGWRSCTSDVPRSATWSGQLGDLRCGLARWSAALERDCRERSVLRYLDTRETLIKAGLEAPFWSEGGDLYLHVLLPHPPAGRQVQPSLEAAYESNLSQAADLLRRLGERLHQRFPDDFRLVVFSDHPLRPMPDCGAGYSGRCEVPVRYAEPWAVPLIVATPRPVALEVPVSNLTLLDLQVH